MLCPHIFLLCGKHKIRYANTQIICISPKVIHFSCFSEDDLLYNIEGNYYSYTRILYVFLSEILRKKLHLVFACLKKSYNFPYFSDLRKVYPYYFTFTTFTKGRWVGERILDVFAREFRAHPTEEYVSRRLNFLMNKLLTLHFSIFIIWSYHTKYFGEK